MEEELSIVLAGRCIVVDGAGVRHQVNPTRLDRGVIGRSVDCLMKMTIHNIETTEQIQATISNQLRFYETPIGIDDADTPAEMLPIIRWSCEIIMPAEEGSTVTIIGQGPDPRSAFCMALMLIFQNEVLNERDADAPDLQVFGEWTPSPGYNKTAKA